MRAHPSHVSRAITGSTQRTGLLAALMAALLSGALAAPAAADSVVLVDGAGDTWSQTLTEPAQPAPTVTNGDVRRVKVAHKQTRIVVRSIYTGLARSGSYAQHIVMLRTAQGATYEVRAEASKRRWRGATRLFRGNREIDCAIPTRIVYERRVVRVAVPRRCLGNPTFVRAQASNAWVDGDGVWHLDNAHDDRPRTREWTRLVKSG